MPRIIDLTLPLRPGQRGVATEPKYTVAKDGWNAATWHLYSHAGTHMDAQLHFAAGPETIDTKPLASCMGPAWVVPLAPVEPRALLGVAHLGEVAGQFRDGDSLLLRTDWHKHADTPALYRDGLPRISEELARWCVARRVKMLGVEPPSIADVNQLPEVTLIHQILLGGGVTIVEGLAFLDQLTQPRVFFAALPLKLAGGDGCPVRAFAVEDRSRHPHRSDIRRIGGTLAADLSMPLPKTGAKSAADPPVPPTTPLVINQTRYKPGTNDPFEFKIDPDVLLSLAITF